MFTYLGIYLIGFILAFLIILFFHAYSDVKEGSVHRSRFAQRVGIEIIICTLLWPFVFGGLIVLFVMFLFVKLYQISKQYFPKTIKRIYFLATNYLKRVFVFLYNIIIKPYYVVYKYFVGLFES